jgi:hypothetical protein
VIAARIEAPTSVLSPNQPRLTSENRTENSSEQQPDQRRGGRGGRHEPDDEHLPRLLHPLVLRYRGHPDGLNFAAHPPADASRAFGFIRPVSDAHHEKSSQPLTGVPAWRAFVFLSTSFTTGRITCRHPI